MYKKEGPFGVSTYKHSVCVMFSERPARCLWNQLIYSACFIKIHFQITTVGQNEWVV